MREMRAWNFAWSRLAVCDFPPAGKVNCGRCEKCCRVRLQLEVTGLAGLAQTLPAELVSSEEIASLSLDFLIDYFWEPLVPGMRRSAEPGQRRPRGASPPTPSPSGLDRRTGLRGRLRRFDRRYFGGVLGPSRAEGPPKAGSHDGERRRRVLPSLIGQNVPQRGHFRDRPGISTLHVEQSIARAIVTHARR